MKKTTIHNARVSDVKRAVDKIWYAYAEGFLPAITGTVADDKLYEVADKWMPSGWTVSVQPSGSVYASKPMLKQGHAQSNTMTVLVVQKEADGHERTFEVML